MMKSPNVPNKLCSELSFGFEYFKFSVCFGFRYSDFEFREELCILGFRLVHSICKDFINLKKYLVSRPSSLAAAARLPSVLRNALITNSFLAVFTPSR
jgi:hypothetical protein